MGGEGRGWEGREEKEEIRGERGEGKRERSPDGRGSRGGTGGKGWKEVEKGGSKIMHNQYSNLSTGVKLQWGPYPWFPSCVHHHHFPIISGAP